MDALSDVLKSVRLEGAVYLNAEFTAPWCVSAGFGLGAARARLAGAEHVLYFHYLAEGGCKVRLASGEVRDAAAQDLVIFPQEEHHVMGSDLQLAPVAAGSLLPPNLARDTDVVQLRHGGGGEATRIVCGYLACDRTMCRLLFDPLPRVLLVPIRDGPASTMLRELLRTGVRESSASRPGADSLLAKLSELMFVEAMRVYAESLPPEGKGWLAAVRDAHVGRALALLHAEPKRDWTVEDLAREAALSRSALAERFAALVGEPPMQYLTRWRLTLAAAALRAGGRAVARIAEEYGYESESAFNRAFKREFDVPPAAWRRRMTKEA
jgi:AraC family transcriptional regulator, alkane utilization regulator